MQRGGNRNNAGRKKITNGKKITFVIPVEKIEEVKKYIKKIQNENITK
jgi:hypothetical protein